MNSFHIKKLKQINLDKMLTAFPLAAKNMIETGDTRILENVNDRQKIILENIKYDLKLTVAWKDKEENFLSFCNQMQPFFEKPLIKALLYWINEDSKYIKRLIKVELSNLEKETENIKTENPALSLLSNLYYKEEVVLSDVEGVWTEVREDLEINYQTVSLQDTSKFDDIYTKILNGINTQDHFKRAEGIILGGIIVKYLYETFIYIRDIYYKLEKDHSLDIDKLFEKELDFFALFDVKEPKIITKKWNKIDGSYLKDDYFHSDMDLDKADVKKFLNFLSTEKNNAGQPFLNENEVIELIGIGFKIPQNGIPTQKFTLNINSKEIGKIYGCFHRLWTEKASAKNAGSEFWCAYLHTYFTNYKHKPVILMKNSFRAKSQSDIGFLIKNYLPD